MLKCIFEDNGEASLRHVVTQAVVCRDKEILLIKRAEGMLEGGKWALPGGFVDRDETIEEAVAREIQEETGWEVEGIRLLSVYDNPDRPHEDRQNIAFNYVCQAKNEKGTPDNEVTAVEWVAINDPRLNNLAFDHTKVVNEFLQPNI